MRFVQRGGERQASIDVHDAYGSVRPTRADHAVANAHVSHHPRPRDRRFLELRDGQARTSVQAEAALRPDRADQTKDSRAAPAFTVILKGESVDRRFRT